MQPTRTFLAELLSGRWHMTRAGLTVRIPFQSGGTVRAITADAQGTSGNLPADFRADSQGGIVEFVVPRLELSAILILEPSLRK